jgi:hypothetical protein
MGSLLDESAIGGFMAGNRARIDEDTQVLNQGLTLEQIANAQQLRQSEIQNQQRLGAAETRTAELHPLAVEEKQNANRAALQKITREEGQQGLEDFARVVGSPGWEDYMTERHPKFVKNPLFKVGIEAHKKDTAGYGPGERPEGPSMMEQLLERVGRTPATIEQRQREESKERIAQTAVDQRERASVRNDETRRYGLELMSQTKIATSNIAAKAAASGSKTLQQLAASYVEQANDAALKNDTEAATRLRAQANELLGAMTELNVAKNVQQENAIAARLEKFAPGMGQQIVREVKASIGAAPVQGGGANPAKPAVAAPQHLAGGLQANGWAYEPDKYDYEMRGKVLGRKPKSAAPRPETQSQAVDRILPAVGGATTATGGEWWDRE